MSDVFRIGQRWISNAEPDLGLGQVVASDARLVSLRFEVSDTERTYARDSAPLTRATFARGDRVHARDGIQMIISRITERDGLFVYEGDYAGTPTAILETDLDPSLRFSRPQERLFTHQFDTNEWFNLRYQTRMQQARLAGLRTRGLQGPRVSLIPHQLFIAAEVSSRFAPRVLLADEVGLGKTIEAGLVIHHQLLTGAAERVLVIVPPALTFQWFVELIRRFNLQFVLLDEERCEVIEYDNLPEDDETATFNPFEAQQLMICSLDLFGSERRLGQLLEADWDLVVVDEAHHLRWEPGNASPEYEVVRALAERARGLLLLTATPEQLGLAGHFARLRLLDPARYHDFDAFSQEESSYQGTAELANALLAGDDDAETRLRAEYGDHSRDDLVQLLLDRHGTGRVLLRNVRQAVAGFPARQLVPTMLPTPEGYDTASPWPHVDVPNWTARDPRVPWLLELARSVDGEKLLVICAQGESAIALEAALGDNTGLRTGVFHEGMDLVQRDRAAAYFAEPERGAQVLVCSEIGSEGRNFQFAHHLVLFDLPESPDLLEQRIGRLDRIGQTRDVVLHVPVLEGTRHAYLFSLYRDGLGLFEQPNPVAQAVFDDLDGAPDDAGTLERARAMNVERVAALQRGRDRLLELNSHNGQVSSLLVEEIRTSETDDDLERYMEASFDAFGLESDPLSPGVLLIKPTEGMVRHASVSIETLDHYHYPELPESGVTCTYDRDIALAREDAHFFTWEHPIVQQALEVVSSDTLGNCCVVVIDHPRLPRGTLLVETLHLVDCAAPPKLDAGRFLPPTVLRSLMTPQFKDLAERTAYNSFIELEVEVVKDALERIVDSQRSGIEAMLSKAEEGARGRLDALVTAALGNMDAELEREESRLRYLASVNSLVRDEEIRHVADTRAALHEHIAGAEVRLDAIRIIIAG